MGPDPVRKFQLLGLLNRFCRREFWQNCVLPNLEEEDPKRVRLAVAVGFPLPMLSCGLCDSIF